jgi:hypothetical protein
LAGGVSQASSRETASELFGLCNRAVLPFKWSIKLTQQLQSRHPDWPKRIRRFKGADKWLELAIKYSWLPSEARPALVPSGVPIDPLIDFISKELSQAVDSLMEKDVWDETVLRMQGVITTLLGDYWQSFEANGGNRQAPAGFITQELYTMARFAAITLEDEPSNVVVRLGDLTDAIRSDPALAGLGPQSESNRVAPLPFKPTDRDVRTRHRSSPLPPIDEAHRIGLSPGQIEKRGNSAYTNRYICLSRFDQTDFRRSGVQLHWRDTTIPVVPMYPNLDGTMLTYPILVDSTESLSYWLALIGQVRVILTYGCL